MNGEDRQGLSYEIEIKANGITEHKHYVSLGSMSFALYVQRTGTNLGGKPAKQTSYFQNDHLGSLAVLTNEAGVVIERLAYDPWGKRRNVNGISDPNDTLAGVNTERGYTMHEHLDEMGVIHMNGRVYDPAIGRFMSADPFIQAPNNLQSFNRYAYVMNNPLAFTDPSGYFSLKKFFRTVAAIVVGIYAPQFLPGILQSAGLGILSGKVAVGAIAGGLASSAGAGSFKAFGQGALTGGLFAGAGIVGEGAGMKGSFAHYAAHAGAGCVSAVAGGGKCGQGAASALVGKFVTLNTEGIGGAGISGDIARGVAASVGGGLASAAGGGKFSSGAETAAFGYMFNYCQSVGCVRELQSKVNDFFRGLSSPLPKAAMYVGFGGSGTAGPFTFTGDTGVGLDTRGNICLQTTSCAGAGWTADIGGGLGVVGQVQQGVLTAGSQSSNGVAWMGGKGLFGEGQVQIGDDGIQYGRALVGVGATASGGKGSSVTGGTALTCQTTTVVCSRGN